MPSSQPGGSIDVDALIAAVHRDELAELDHRQARAVCAAIGRRVADEVAAVVAELAAAGITVGVDDNPARPAQRHAATLSVADAGTAIAAVRALGHHGFRAWDPINGAAEPIVRRFRHRLTIARTTDVTMVVDLQWPRPTGLAGRVPELMIPNENDYDAVSLPSAVWPLYFLFRPLRLAAQRLGLGRSSRHALGPFLSTPFDLIDPLLDLAAVTENDVLVDLGCGDARILRHAVSERRCLGVGVESDHDLVAEARRLVDDDGLADHITIIEGDAAARLPPEVRDGTVFFLFVPAHSVPDVAKRVLGEAQPGARLVVHEQHPLPDLGAPTERKVIINGQGVSVAHLLVVTGRDE